MRIKKSLIICLPIFLSLVSCGGGTSSSVATTSTSTAASSSQTNSATTSRGGGGFPGGGTTTTTSIAVTGTYEISSSAWSYDATNNVYYQVGINYCTSPVNTSYESMGIFVPGNYFSGSVNSDGKYTCTVNASGKQGNYTSATAPIVFPVNTPGYASQAAPGSYSYSSYSSYLSQGLIYVCAGMRGKDAASGEAPWGVTDLKSAVRCYRYNKDNLPGDDGRIFTFGHSGGGAQSSLMGSSGDSPLYTPYLEAIGAPMKDKSGNALSDAVAGAMCWCPITSLDVGDEAYEWNMGQFFTSSTRTSGTFTSALSQDMASSFGDIINNLQLKNGNETLSLSPSSSGTYLAGTYYDYILSVISESLNNYLSDNNVTDKASYVSSLGTYATYDSSTGKASVTDLGGFIKANKNASKSVGAFDGPSRGATENAVFRYEDSTSSSSHFDAYEKELLENNNTKYADLNGYVDYRSAFQTDFAATDTVGNDVTYRSKMYNPMYYLSDKYEGYQTSSVAKYWRIRTGLNQTDTALTTEVNLALALKEDSSRSVDFATVWGQGHTQAERTGTASSNFILWVESCCQ
jgi:hypothetical protein